MINLFQAILVHSGRRVKPMQLIRWISEAIAFCHIWIGKAMIAVPREVHKRGRAIRQLKWLVHFA